jgi:hypothetical protein
MRPIADCSWMGLGGQRDTEFAYTTVASRSPGTIRTFISVVPILPFAVLAFCTFFVPDSSGMSASSVLVGH